MLATWIETAAKGRSAGPIRAGMWSAAVIGTHPVGDNQRVWLEILADDLDLGRIPAYWIENKAGNSFWHAPIPPQAVGVRLHYRSVAEHEGGEIALSATRTRSSGRTCPIARSRRICWEPRPRVWSATA